MYIASASNVVKVHEFPSKALIHNHQPTSKIEGSCRSISWSRDGNWIAVVPHLGFAEIVSLKGQCKVLHSVQDVSEPSCASFQNLTKRNLAVGTKHGQVLLYDIKARSVKARYPRTSSAITHVGFTAKDTHCYTGCANGEILLFNSVAKNLSCTLRVPKSNSLTDVKAHLQKRNFLIAGSNEGVIVVWDTNVNKVRFCNEAHKAPVTATIFSPINTSLIVSAGLDRQVCVFDIENRQRITNIPVENNILALDFLDDSMYIIMGSQNGKIHIYDSRNLPKPVSSFDAHESAIRHLAYQGIPDEVFSSNTSSLSSITSEEILRPSRSNEEVQTGKKRTSDFFGITVQGPSSVSDSFDGIKRIPTNSSMEGGDSFIQALGLDRNNTAESLNDEGSYHGDSKNKLVFENKLPTLNEFPYNSAKTIHDKLGLCDSKNKRQTMSTPKLASDNFFAAVSPIISSSSNPAQHGTSLSVASVAEIQNVTKEIIQAEVKKSLNELETKVIYQFMHINYQLRRMVLDLHMSILKEFDKVENYCKSIKEEINSEPATSRESYLLEENVNLKKRIQELENHISCLTVQSPAEEKENRQKDI